MQGMMSIVALVPVRWYLGGRGHVACSNPTQSQDFRRTRRFRRNLSLSAEFKRMKDEEEQKAMYWRAALQDLGTTRVPPARERACG